GISENPIAAATAGTIRRRIIDDPLFGDRRGHRPNNGGSEPSKGSNPSIEGQAEVRRRLEGVASVSATRQRASSLSRPGEREDAVTTVESRRPSKRIAAAPSRT